MNKWTKLSELKDPWVRRGSLLRVPRAKSENGEWYSDPYTDFLVFDAGDSFGLIVASGQKAGMKYVIFPVESSLPSEGPGLSRAWLYENWNKWVYPDGKADDALIRPPIAISSWDQ